MLFEHMCTLGLRWGQLESIKQRRKSVILGFYLSYTRELDGLPYLCASGGEEPKGQDDAPGRATLSDDRETERLLLVPDKSNYVERLFPQLPVMVLLIIAPPNDPRVKTQAHLAPHHVMAWPELVHVMFILITNRSNRAPSNCSIKQLTQVAKLRPTPQCTIYIESI